MTGERAEKERTARKTKISGFLSKGKRRKGGKSHRSVGKGEKKVRKGSSFLLLLFAFKSA